MEENNSVNDLIDVLEDGSKQGTVKLSQGYGGKFAPVYRWKSDFKHSNKPFVYTHFCNTISSDKVLKEIYVAGDDDTCSFLTSYSEKLPTINTLKQCRTIAEFEKYLGKFSGMTDMWGDANKMHSSMGWLKFSLDKNKKIRSLNVFINIVSKDKNNWAVDGIAIDEGYFAPNTPKK